MILQRKRAVFQLIFTSPAFAGKNNSVDAPVSRPERQMTHKSTTCCQRPKGNGRRLQRTRPATRSRLIGDGGRNSPRQPKRPYRERTK